MGGRRGCGREVVEDVEEEVGVVAAAGFDYLFAGGGALRKGERGELVFVWLLVWERLFGCCKGGARVGGGLGEGSMRWGVGSE